MDEMVRKTQIYLNTTYRNKPGYNIVAIIQGALWCKGYSTGIYDIDQYKLVNSGSPTIRMIQQKLNRRYERFTGMVPNAICMTCGRVSPISKRKPFEELAIMFEGSTASGAERAYRRAVEKLTVLLVEAGTLHAIRLRRKSVKRIKKKIAAAVYEYQADCDGEWGEIQFDFENGTAVIVRLAEWDTMVSKIFAEQIMKYIRACDADNLPKKSLLAF